MTQLAECQANAQLHNVDATAEAQDAHTFSWVRHGRVLRHVAERCLLGVTKSDWIVGVGRPHQKFH